MLFTEPQQFDANEYTAVFMRFSMTTVVFANNLLPHITSTVPLIWLLLTELSNTVPVILIEMLNWTLSTFQWLHICNLILNKSIFVLSFADV